MSAHPVQDYEGHRGVRLSCDGDPACQQWRGLTVAPGNKSPHDHLVHLARESSAHFAGWSYSPETGDRCPDHQPA